MLTQETVLRTPAAAPDGVPPLDLWLDSLACGPTRRAYVNDVQAFMAFAGISERALLPGVTRELVQAWRDELVRRGRSGATVRRKLAALSSLFAWLMEARAMAHNPAQGVRRPRAVPNRRHVAILADQEARRLLDAPPTDTLKGKRDRAILSVLLFDALRSEELARLRVCDFSLARRGCYTLRVHGSRGRQRCIAVHPHTQGLLNDYLRAADHGKDTNGPLFRPVRNPRVGHTDTALTPHGVYCEAVLRYVHELGLNGEHLGPQVLRATAAASALRHHADLRQVQEWLGHASLNATRDYAPQHMREGLPPSLKVAYDVEAAPDPDPQAAR